MARKSLIVIVASMISLIGVGVWAQQQRLPWLGPPPERPQRLTLRPEVLSGENIGVRLTGTLDQNGRIQGTLVVKVNGQWVDVLSAPVGAAK